MFDEEDEINPNPDPNQIKIDALLLEALTYYDILERELTLIGLQEEEDESKYPPHLLVILDKIDHIQAQLDILLPSEETLEAYE